METDLLVKQMFDDMGRSSDPEEFSMWRDLFIACLGDHPVYRFDFFKFMLGGLTVVYDANIVQKAIRWELRTKKSSDLINVAKSGFIIPLSPTTLDEEISEHIPEIARDNRVSELEVLNLYLHKIRPFLKLVNVSDPEILKSVQASIRDVDDAVYVAVHLEHKTLAIVTADRDVKEYPGKVECYAISDIVHLNILYRKFYVIFFTTIAGIALFFSGCIAFVKFLWKFKKWIFWGLLISTVLFLLYKVLKKKPEELQDDVYETNDKESFAWRICSSVFSFLISYARESYRQISTFNKTVKPMFRKAKAGIAIGKSLPEQKYPSYVNLIKMIMVSMGGKVVRETDVCAAFSELGYPVKGKGSHRFKIRTALKNSSFFIRLKNGGYVLRTQESE